MSAPLLVSLFSLGILVKCSSGFSNNPKICFLSIKNQPQQLKQRSRLFSSPLEDYDQWVEQLDPSVFEEDDAEDYGTSPRSRGTGTRRHQGRQHEEYERDYDADNSRVDEDAINQLIAERSRARRQRQFEEADAIRDELLEQHGVRLLDREKLWRSGCSSSGSGKQWGRNGNRDTNGRGGRREQGRERGPRRPVQDFGPNGHDYLPSPDQGPHASDLSIPEIHDLLAERLECKLSRNFRRADAIQNELFENGVYVHDGFKEWRSDGSPFPGGADRRGKPQPDPLARTDNRRRVDPYQPYEMSEYSQPLLNVDSNEDDDLAQEAAQALQERIQELVDERAEAKRVRDYRTADLLRDELRMDYGVEIDDNRRVWSKGGLFDEPPGPYKMSPYSLPLSSLLQEDEEGSSEEQHSTLLQTIEDLVEERSQAKGLRDYEKADDIRDTLSGQYNVLVNDRLRQWSIGGQFEPPPEPYTMLEDSEVPETIDVETINEKLMDRDMARGQKAFQIADDILSELSNEHGIVVDDKSREWWYGIQPETRDAYSGSSTMSQYYKRRGGGDVSEEDALTITEMLQERLECKRNKEFGKADRIRDRLQNEFGCRVDDKNMEWHIVTSAYVQGSTPADMDEATATYIQEQVDKRAVAKLKRDYELADTIRDSLMDEYNVRIDDRVKEWNVLSVRPSRASQDDEFLQDDEYDEYEEDDDEYDDDDDDDEQNVPEAVDSNVSASTGTEEQEKEASDDTADLEGLTVVALKEKLRAKNLPVSGKKAELIERLISG